MTVDTFQTVAEIARQYPACIFISKTTFCFRAHWKWKMHIREMPEMISGLLGGSSSGLWFSAWAQNGLRQ